MSEIECIAIFTEAEQAYRAAEKLHQLRHHGIRARIAAHSAVRVRAPEISADIVTAALRTAGALDMTCHAVMMDSDWMSHQNGAVTGTGVEPGAGDSEAGT